MVFGIILEYNSEPFLTRVYARPNWEIFRIPGSEPARLTSDERLRGLFRIADLGFRDFHRIVIVLHVPGGPRYINRPWGVDETYACGQQRSHRPGVRLERNSQINE